MKYGKTTDNIYLNKPDLKDIADILDLNENSDRLDVIIHKLRTDVNLKAALENTRLYGDIQITNPGSKNKFDLGLAATTKYVDDSLTIKEIVLCDNRNNLPTIGNFNYIYLLKNEENVPELIWNGSEYIDKTGKIIIKPEFKITHYECRLVENKTLLVGEQVKLEIIQFFENGASSVYEGPMQVSVNNDSIKIISIDNDCITIEGVYAGTSTINVTIPNSNIENNSCNLDITTYSSRRIVRLKWSKDELIIDHRDSAEINLIAVYNDGSEEDITENVRIFAFDTSVVSITDNVIKAINVGETELWFASSFVTDIMMPRRCKVICKSIITELKWNVSNTTIRVGDTLPVTLIAKYSDNKTEKDVTSQYNLIVSNKNIIMLTNNIVTALNNGTATLDFSPHPENIIIPSPLEITVDKPYVETYTIRKLSNTNDYIDRVMSFGNEYNVVTGFNAKFQITNSNDEFLQLLDTKVITEDEGTITISNDTDNNAINILSTMNLKNNYELNITGDLFGINKDLINLKLTISPRITALKLQYNDAFGVEQIIENATYEIVPLDEYKDILIFNEEDNCWEILAGDTAKFKLLVNGESHTQFNTHLVDGLIQLTPKPEEDCILLEVGDYETYETFANELDGTVYVPGDVLELPDNDINFYFRYLPPITNVDICYNNPETENIENLSSNMTLTNNIIIVHAYTNGQLLTFTKDNAASLLKRYHFLIKGIKVTTGGVLEFNINKTKTEIENEFEIMLDNSNIIAIQSFIEKYENSLTSYSRKAFKAYLDVNITINNQGE